MLLHVIERALPASTVNEGTVNTLRFQGRCGSLKTVTYFTCLGNPDHDYFTDSFTHALKCALFLFQAIGHPLYPKIHFVVD